MTAEREALVKRADEVLKDVTPGPWRWREEAGPQWFLAPGILAVEVGMTDGTPIGDAIDRANARFIAAARELVPAMRDRIEADAKRIAELERSRDDWRDDYRTLEKAIVGDTGLSAMTIAAQARTFRPRAALEGEKT